MQARAKLAMLTHVQRIALVVATDSRASPTIAFDSRLRVKYGAGIGFGRASMVIATTIAARCQPSCWARVEEASKAYLCGQK